MRFEIDPRVVFRLGEDLISDDAQAVAELIKNAYDADSPWVRVRVDTREAVPSLQGDRTLRGTIAVEDAGSGMTAKQIEHGWLRIAVSEKRVMKGQGRTTPKGRTPLGDKGLGRLGAQRLGEEIELETRAKAAAPLRVRFSWSDFARFETLSSVPVETTEGDRTRPGTTIRILGLREHGYWTSSQGRATRLQRELAQIISPYEGVAGFDVSVVIDDVVVDLFELTSRLRDTAQARYAFDFDGEVLRAQGDIRLAFLQPNRTTGAEVENFQRFALHDSGRAFFEFLSERPGAASWGLRRPKNKRAFAGFEWRVPIDDIPDLIRENGELISPGPYHGEVDGFDLGHGTVAAQDLVGSAAEYRQLVRELAGVRVYRDGFLVRTADNDPLRLRRAATSGRSAYALKPDTTTGFLAISARENEALVEKTDREGFQDTPAFRNFTSILERFARDVDQIHNAIGRGWVEFVRERLAREASADPGTQTHPDAAADVLAEHLAEGRELAERVANVAAKIETASRTADTLEAKGEDANPAALAGAARDARAAVNEAASILGEIERYLEGLNSVATLPALLGHEITALRDQIVVSQETMSLGITAEALVHELMNVCDQLEARSVAFGKQASSGTITERDATAYSDYVRSTARSLRKQTSHLQPSLRYVRDRRDPIVMSGFLEEMASHYRRRLAGTPLTVEASTAVDFTVRMNRGKLTQVFDNLLLNSEYWLRQELTRGTKAGSIKVAADRPLAVVEDTGPGITPERAARVFEPFVSSKPEGRGLGLFIVRQLLDSEGCSIYIGPETNRRGNHYRFVVDLSGALDS